MEAQFKRKEKIVAFGFAIFVPFFLVGSYAPFVPIQWLPVLGIVALVPVAAILVLYNERGKEDQRSQTIVTSGSIFHWESILWRAALRVRCAC